MVQAMDAAWRKAEGLKKLTHEARDLYRHTLLPNELGQFDAALINPPRAGAKAQVRELAQSWIKTIAYVSCNPVNFPRDSTLLKHKSYDLTYVQTVDQFHLSPHVEHICAFSKE